MKKVTIGLDRERELRFNINALTEIEDRFNRPFHDVLAKEQFSVNTIRALVYIALKHGGMKFKGRNNEENETLCGELIQEHWFEKGMTLKELFKLVVEALAESGVLKDVDEDEEEESNPTKDAQDN